MNLKHHTDEDLAILAQGQGPGGTAEAELVQRYWAVAGHEARDKPIKGIDFEDREAACLEVLVKAIRRFELGRNSSFKHFAKKLMRNELTELFRSVTREKDIPQKFMRSIDEPVSQDDGEVSMVDCLAGETEATLIAGLMSDILTEEAQALQWQRFKDAIEDMDNTAQSRLSTTILSVAKLMLIPDEYADLRDLLAEATGQMILLPMAPAKDSQEAQEIARKVFIVYSELLSSVIADKVGGFELAEIAERASVQVGYPIDRAIVSSILGSTRQEAALAA